jgi:hypothetical protein
MNQNFRDDNDGNDQDGGGGAATFFDDLLIECAECRQDFMHSARDQAFFAQMQFGPPKRCRDCRAAFKALREAGGGGPHGWR